MPPTADHPHEKTPAWRNTRHRRWGCGFPEAISPTLRPPHPRRDGRPACRETGGMPGPRPSSPYWVARRADRPPGHQPAPTRHSGEMSAHEPLQTPSPSVRPAGRLSAASPASPTGSYLPCRPQHTATRRCSGSASKACIAPPFPAAAAAPRRRSSRSIPPGRSRPCHGSRARRKTRRHPQVSHLPAGGPRET